MGNPMMGGGLLQGSITGMLDLEPSIHRHHSSQQAMIPHSQNSQQQQQQQQQQTYHLHPAIALSSDHPMSVQHHHQGKLLSSSASDDDDHELSFLNDDTGGVRGKKGSTAGGSSSSAWHRMKWTNEIVRLLITVVACVGDDGVADSFDGSTGTKRKAGGGGCGVMQKKGKWKTVSKLMLERGCSVTPQQCEDKLNDLNKRYKRLNEILGRGTTCQVVENPSLLDSMANVSPKGKDDVRKILSSKHLFYREMCAYNNGQRIPNSNDIESHGCGVSSGPIAVRPLKDSEIVVSEDGDGERENLELGKMSNGSFQLGMENLELGKMSNGSFQLGMENLELEKMSNGSFQLGMDEAFQNRNKTLSEQRDWFRRRALQLQEERLGIQAEAFELEKRRFKWQRFCSKKDRELEMMRLENERMALEIEHTMMQVKQKIELVPEKSKDIEAFAGFKFDIDQ